MYEIMRVLYMGWYSDKLYNWYTDPNHPAYLDPNYEHEYVNSNKNAGTHFIQFYLNNNYTIKPRIGMQWKAHPRHIFSAGFGIHSRKESLTLYSGNFTAADGTVIHPNRDLELAKARHYVLGYNFLATQLPHLKTEIYYQDLYDIPAIN